MITPITPEDRAELRKDCNKRISDGTWTEDTGNVLRLLDALDEAEREIERLRGPQKVRLVGQGTQP